MHLIPSEPPATKRGHAHVQTSIFSEPMAAAADNPGEWFKLSEPVSRKSVTRARKNHGARFEFTTRIEDLPRDGKKVYAWIRARIVVAEPPVEPEVVRTLEAV